MENSNYNNKNHQNNINDSLKLTISLRKKKLNQILSQSKVKNESYLSKQEEENENMSKLCELSKSLFEQKEVDNIINILDKIYFFIKNIKIPLKPNFIKLSSIIPHLYQKISLFEVEEVVIKKIFDIFEEILKFFSFDEIDKENYIVFNEQYFQLIFRLIELYQNNEKIMKTIFNFLSCVIEKSTYLKEYFMKKPGCCLIQSILSLDVLYPSKVIQLLHSFCNCENLDESTMKEFEIFFIQECNKIISQFYEENLENQKIVFKNSKLFHDLYSCFSFISTSELKEVKDIFLINDKISGVSLFDKIISFEQFDRDNLSIKVLEILVNLFCYEELKYIEILIENNSYQYVMDRLLDNFSNKNIIHEASSALANFVNTPQYKKIFMDNQYLKDIICKIRNNNSYEIIKDLLFIISNFFFAIDEIDILSFIDSDIFVCCIELLINKKEPTILNSVLSIIEILLYKGNPNNILKSFYKESEEGVINPFKYQFDIYGLYDILSNTLINTKNEKVSSSIRRIICQYYNKKEIIID